MILSILLRVTESCKELRKGVLEHTCTYRVQVTKNLHFFRRLILPVATGALLSSVREVKQKTAMQKPEETLRSTTARNACKFISEGQKAASAITC